MHTWAALLLIGPKWPGHVHNGFFYFYLETLAYFDARAIKIADLSRYKPKRG